MARALKWTRWGVMVGAVVLGVAMAAATAHAGLGSAKVQKAFRGALVITATPVDVPGGTDHQVIAALKRMRVTHLASDDGRGEQWQFSFIGFLKHKPGVRQLSLDFYTADSRNAYVANKRLTGINPSLALLRGSVTISEDDGVNLNQTYVVKLTATRGRKEIVLAQAKLTLTRDGSQLTMR